ncbi:conserved Plasmodium protein, unknown function [Plasmodium ovale]|uniref:Uncharacterized protein n=2 Tax=Plasmodium ovale TaxID=36330 RepID=A0A1A8VZX6_PLAOA|nr:conserved Plasmodium protein, unknown function [Plasmodium ovale curtisi]SBS94180.1 conserved Plasmodium protein, unknown function [Plasmodium ovale curtisi]SCP05027.1 conserved Plasmodium protein, unknown function [Plasmodium ovale]
MIILYIIWAYFVFICAQYSHEKTARKYEYINLLADRDYKDKLRTLRRYTMKGKESQRENKSGGEDEVKNNYVFSFCGSSGRSKGKLLEHLFNIPSQKGNFVNMGFQQKLHLWFGYDMKGNFNVVLDMDLLENREFIGDRKTVYNYEKLVNLIIESTNSVIIPLSYDDMQMHGDLNEEGHHGKGCNEKSHTSESVGINGYSLHISLPKKVEIFLRLLNEKGRDVHVYFVLINEDKEEMKKNKFDNNFVREIKSKFTNIKNVYLMKENKISLDLLQKNNINKYSHFVDKVEDVIKNMHVFRNFSPFNKKCVYNIYVIEESYNKTLNHFDKLYYEYEEQIAMGKVIKNYRILSNDLIRSALLFFHLLTLEQTGTNFKDTIIEKMQIRFKAQIQKQIVKQLLLLEKMYISQGKNSIIKKFYGKKSKDLVETSHEIELLTKSLMEKFKEDLRDLVPAKKFSQGDSLVAEDADSDVDIMSNIVHQFTNQFEERLEQTLRNYYQLNQSPLKRLFERKRKNAEEVVNGTSWGNKMKRWFNPSINMNLTLTSLVRKSGYGNLQSYFIYDLGILTLVFGLVNDRDTPEVQQQGDKVPFFKFQPKINLKINFK